MGEKPVQELNEERDKATIDAWKKEAKEISDISALSLFIDRLINDYHHDYGTICHAIHAAMIAAFTVVEKSPQGGITGFQASAIGWMEIERLFSMTPGAPLRLIEMEHLLYPQYEHQFTTIQARTWEWVQKEAEKRQAQVDRYVDPRVRAHWESIVAGIVPFGLTVEPERT